MTPSQQHYDNALREVLSKSSLRVLLWRIIVEDCKVFVEDFPMNASAYCLLAKQEIGKRLLADLKVRDIEAVHKAEQEYTIYQELSGKEDAITCILDEYEKNQLYSYDVPNLTMEMIRMGNRYLVEELFVCRYLGRYKDRLTKADVERYLKIYKDKAEIYDFIKDSEVRELFETELSLAEYGFSAEKYKAKNSGDFVVADIAPTIVEEPAPAAPKEGVPRQAEETATSAEVIEPRPDDLKPVEETSRNYTPVVAAAVVAVLVACGVAGFFLVRKNKRRTD